MCLLTQLTNPADYLDVLVVPGDARNLYPERDAKLVCFPLTQAETTLLAYEDCNEAFDEDIPF